MTSTIKPASALKSASAAFGQQLEEAMEALNLLGEVPLHVVPTSTQLQSYGALIVGGGLGTMARQFESIYDALSEQASQPGATSQPGVASQADAASPLSFELLVPESGLDAFGRFYEKCRGAVKVLPGTKVPDLMETYRFKIVIDVVRLPDPARFKEEVAAQAITLFEDAERHLSSATGEFQAIGLRTRRARETKTG